MAVNFLPEKSYYLLFLVSELQVTNSNVCPQRCKKLKKPSVKAIRRWSGLWAIELCQFLLKELL